MPVQHAVLILALLAHTAAAATNALVDPTRPGYPAPLSSQQGSGADTGGWILNSTLVSAERRVAVINGKHVSEGESVGNAIVLQIRKLDVVIRVSGQRITLPLLPDIVKRLP